MAEMIPMSTLDLMVVSAMIMRTTVPEPVQFEGMKLDKMPSMKKPSGTAAVSTFHIPMSPAMTRDITRMERMAVVHRIQNLDLDLEAAVEVVVPSPRLIDPVLDQEAGTMMITD